MDRGRQTVVVRARMQPPTSVAACPRHGSLQTDDLLRQLRSRDPRGAWARFLELYSPLLFDIARRFRREVEAATDCYLYICEQLSANGFRRLLRFRPGGPARFSTWLCAVARVPPSAGAPEADEQQLLRIPSEMPNPESWAGLQEERGALLNAMSRLAAGERPLVKLRFARELTLAEIAKLMGFASPQVADRRIRDVVEKLRGETAGDKPARR